MHAQPLIVHLHLAMIAMHLVKGQSHVTSSGHLSIWASPWQAYCSEQLYMHRASGCLLVLQGDSGTIYVQ